MKKQAGFTLVDMAMMLAVVGVLTASLLSSSTVKKETKYLTTSTTHMQEINDAITQYYIKFGALPCPASATVQPNTASFGKATDCAAAAVAGVTDPAVPMGYAATDAIRIGVVPTRTLALPDSYLFDEWGNRLTYAVIKKLAIDSSNFSAYSTAVTTGVIQINNAGGTQLSSNDPTDFTAYVVVSHGKDAKGSYGVKGVANAACDATNLDKENCNNDYVFINSSIADEVAGAGYFYDLVKVASKSDIDAEAVATVSTSTWTSVALGDGHTCGIKSDSTLWCWGKNTNGQVGDGTTVDKNTPTEVSGGGAWTSVAVSPYYSVCGIKSDSSLWCWGKNNFGQLGDGTTADKNVPTVVTGTWKSISITGEHSCGIKSDNTLWCWGNNQYGRLGDGTATNRSSPVNISVGLTWEKVYAAGYNTCGIRSGGTLVCWGDGPYSENGNNVYADQYSPVGVNGGGTWKDVSLTGGHVCAIKSDDTVWCWGDDGYGQVGNNAALAGQPIPTAISTGGAWSQIQTFWGWWTSLSGSNAEGSHSCALKSDGTIWCWGRNNYGQLGNNTTSNKAIPTTLNGGGTWSKMSTMSTHACGIKSDSTLWCWGKNAAGEVGDATTVTKTVPTAIGTDSWTSVVVGPANHTCAIQSDNSLWCWGENTNGQVGDGTTANKTSPVKIN